MSEETSLLLCSSAPAPLAPAFCWGGGGPYQALVGAPWKVLGGRKKKEKGKAEEEEEEAAAEPGFPGGRRRSLRFPPAFGSRRCLRRRSV